MTQHSQTRARALARTTTVALVFAVLFALLSVALLLLERTSPPSDGWLAWPHAFIIVAGLIAIVLLVVAFLMDRRAHRIARDTPSDFLSSEEEARIVAAIRSFENRTSGEMRVHIEHKCEESPVAAATRVFDSVGMAATRERNGVLFFVDVKGRRFAVVGDHGINNAVDDDFWHEIVRHIETHFVEGEFCSGLVEGIDMAGAALAEHFPPRADDLNELPDDITRS